MRLAKKKSAGRLTMDQMRKLINKKARKNIEQKQVNYLKKYRQQKL